MTKIETQLNHYITDQLEHEPVRSLPSIKGGWGEVKIEGQLGTLIRETPNQKVTVQFTVNDTMPPLEEQDAIEAEDREILCYPAFEVAIEREGKSTVFLNCMSNDPNANNEESEQEDDAFEVISMAISKKEDQDPYIMNMDAMEEDFYDSIHLLLEECGITEDFCQSLVRLATDVETNVYLKAMKDLKHFLE